MDRGAWQATVHVVAELDTNKHAHMSNCHGSETTKRNVVDFMALWTEKEP